MRTVLGSVLIAGMLLATSSSASAAILIKKIAFDPPGADSGSATSLNAEWIVLKNTGTRTKSLSGWKLTDAGAAHVFRFTFSLPAGDVMKLHTGSGQHSMSEGCGGSCMVHHYYWGEGEYVWDNDGDRATLKNGSGTVVDRCSYTGTASSPVAC